MSIELAQKARQEKILNKIRCINWIQKSSKEHIKDFVSKGWVLNTQWTVLGEKQSNGAVIGILVNKTEAAFSSSLIN